MEEIKEIQILMIEDDPDDALIIKDLLCESKDPAFVVDHVYDLKNGLEFLQTNNPDIILLDLNLPDSSGLDTIRALRSYTQNLPVIVISGHSDQMLAMEAVKIGAHDYLVKGIISAPILRRVLLYGLNRHNLRRSLTENIEQYDIIIENNIFGILIIDNSGVIQFSNKKAGELLGKDPEDLIKQDFGIPVVQNRAFHLQAGDRMIELRSRPIVWQKQQAYFVSMYDVTERLKSEQRYQALNRVYRMLLKANEALFQMHDENSLLKEICKIVVEEGGYHFAWVGFADNDRHKTVRPVAYFGREEHYIKGIKISWGKNKFGQGPTGRAIRSGQAVTVQNWSKDPIVAPWRKNGKCFNFKASIALPLKNGDETFGALNIYSKEQISFEPLETELLLKLAGNLSYGIQNLRLKKAKEKNEQALAESYTRFRNLFNSVPVALYIFSMDEKLFEANSFFLKMTGFEKVEDLKAFAFKHGGMSVEADKVLKVLETEDAIHELETQWRTNNGNLIWVKESIRVVRDHQGKILYYEGMAEDITARKAAEQALKASEQKYRRIVDLAQEGIWMLDARARTTFVNQKMADMLGYEAQEMIGRNYFDFIVKDNKKEAVAQWHKQLQGKNIQHELCFLKKDGTKMWGLVSSRPILEEDFQGALKMVVDITEKKLINQQLEETNRQLMSLLESSSAVIYSARWHNGMVAPLQITANLKNIFGYEPQELINNPDLWINNIHPEDKEQVIQAITRINQPGKYSFEYRVKDRAGNYLWVYDEMRIPADWREGTFTIHGLWIDITEKKKLEGQFLRAQRMESLGALAGGIAHDLNNILTPILLATEVLRMRDKKPANEKVMHMIESSAQRGKELIQQILSFARGVEGEHKPVQVRHIIAEVGRIIKETFPKSINFKMSVAKDLWPVLADATQINQVLMNLCVNARDAMPEGGKLEIRAENVVFDEHYSLMHQTAQPGDYIKISVIDSGQGIPEKLINKIFDPFFSTKEVGKGTGLGLSTVHTIIQQHNGFINVYSEPGNGTTFNVYLPANKSAEVEESREIAEDLKGEGQTILVIDDEAAIREIISNTLKDNGYRVLTASDGAQGVAIFAQQKNKTDLVLTDISMPYMDGHSAIRSILKINPDVDIIAMSGLEHDVKVDINRPIKMLNKPFTSQKLLKTMKEVLAVSTKTKEKQTAN
ncbi:multi-sensor hybrid histidine kinase [Caldithrix abyssi DSM 13497]|uniref:histidine kinase n=1 Tax=Caldithrix abyssi DSM 13497 TaxID=880073 RepID=H1XSY7_CALAY|nr:PAS domain S-box protein [Caldithrix abyssi]APF17294.1 PAS domain S-box-containing protein [Caldithrix abyssi DSM 13497]EHO41416.1 multi-sensor hybrid histidine kinase [Caldithrix abyssi DSM 13497]